MKTYYSHIRGESLLEMNDFMRYSMKLAFLRQLLDKKLLTEKEYALVKSRLMKDYKVVSDLMT